MGVLETNIAYIQNKFPEVNCRETTDGILFLGRFVIRAKHGDFCIQIAPFLELKMPYDYPKSLPAVRDIDNAINYDHKFANGYLCLGTTIDLKFKLQASICISDYIDSFFIPYFLNYEYWKRYKTDLYGDRSHGIDGVIESIQDFFNTPHNDPEKLLFLITWASKKIKYRRLLQKSDKYKFMKKYAVKIGELRKLEISRLKALYKLIELCLRLPPEKLKNNDEYNRLYYLACS